MDTGMSQKIPVDGMVDENKGDCHVNIWHSLWSWQHGTVCLTGFE
jgi:hypothetical protein